MQQVLKRKSYFIDKVYYIIRCKMYLYVSSDVNNREGHLPIKWMNYYQLLSCKKTGKGDFEWLREIFHDRSNPN